MKIVTVCEHGNKRSVHAAYLMRFKRKVDGGGMNDVIPIGIKTSSEDMQTMLFDWADWIILTDIRYLDLINPKYNDKMHIWDVGEDRWPSTFNKELLDLLRLRMEEDFSKNE